VSDCLEELTFNFDTFGAMKAAEIFYENLLFIFLALLRVVP
jgi:hypothetical protein